MVPFWLVDRCGSSELHQTYRVRQLEFLKWLCEFRGVFVNMCVVTSLIAIPLGITTRPRA